MPSTPLTPSHSLPLEHARASYPWRQRKRGLTNRQTGRGTRRKCMQTRQTHSHPGSRTMAYTRIYIYIYIERASTGREGGGGWCSGAQPRLKQGRNNEDLKGWLGRGDQRLNEGVHGFQQPHWVAIRHPQAKQEQFAIIITIQDLRAERVRFSVRLVPSLTRNTRCNGCTRPRCLGNIWPTFPRENFLGRCLVPMLDAKTFLLGRDWRGEVLIYRHIESRRIKVSC